MQAPDALPKILDLLVSPATSVAAIYFYDRFIARKRNGPDTKEVLHNLDRKLTEHFDQLRRDLSTTIEKASENSIMRYMWEAEKRWLAEAESRRDRE